MKRVHRPAMASASSTSQQRRNQMTLRAECGEAVLEAVVLKGTNYTLCAFKSKVSFGFLVLRLGYVS